MHARRHMANKVCCGSLTRVIMTFVGCFFLKSRTVCCIVGTFPLLGFEKPIGKCSSSLSRIVFATGFLILAITPCQYLIGSSPSWAELKVHQRQYWVPMCLCAAGDRVCHVHIVHAYGADQHV